MTPLLVAEAAALPWSLVAVAVYLTLLLLTADLLWRTTPIGGRKLLIAIALLGLGGTLLIVRFLG